MSEERRKEQRVRRRLRATVETADGRHSAVVTAVSEHGLGLGVDAPLARSARVVVTILLPSGRARFEAVVRHARRTAEAGGGYRAGLELAESPPEPYLRFVREELTALIARSGAGAGDEQPPPASPPPARGRRGIPSPIALKAAATAAPAPAPAPSPGRKGTRRSTPRRLKPKTPSRGAAAAAATGLSRLEPGLHGIATARLPEGTAVDALSAGAVMRDAALEAVDGLLPSGRALSLVSADVGLAQPGDDRGSSIAAAARLAELDAKAGTLCFDAEVTRGGRPIARGRLTFRLAG